MKKSWHTQTYRVMEKVWKAEQAALEEQKKAEQLRKELVEERQMEEMRRMQEAAGHVKYAPPACPRVTLSAAAPG